MSKAKALDLTEKDRAELEKIMRMRTVQARIAWRAATSCCSRLAGRQ